MPSLLFLTALILAADSLKILSFNPKFGVSHVTTMGRMADVLAEAGHEVVTLMPIIDATLKTEGTKKSRMIYVPPANETADWVARVAEAMHAECWRDSNNPMQIFQRFGQMHSAFQKQCASTLAEPGLIERLKAEKFDFAYGEIIHACAFTLFDILGIDKYAVALPSTTADSVNAVFGGAVAPSYVPSMMSTTGPEMTFAERAANLAIHVVGSVLTNVMFSSHDAFVASLGHHLTPMAEQYARASLVFVNSDPLIEYPRPTLHKIIDIGGIGVPPRNDKPLDKEWDELLSLRPHTVYVSFGSVAHSHLMPAEFKEAIREVFRRFPDVTFVWKYERPEHDITRGIPNAVTKPWVPQQQLLGDPRLSLFVTHGGAASTNEAIYRGIPVVAVGVFGDQKRNARLMEHIGSGLSMAKEDLAKPDELERRIRRVLTEESFRETAKKTAALLAEKPFSSEELLVKNVEFAAQFGPLTQLDPHSRQLSFVQYYMLDVLGALVATLLALLSIVVVATRAIIRCVFGGARKAKRE